MSFRQKAMREIKQVGLVTIYFICWLAVLVLLKQLILAEYDIRFHRVSMAIVGALVLAKVVLVLERVPLGAWVRARPAWVDVLLRTALCSLGVFVLIVLEKSFEGRHEHGGFVSSMIEGFRQANGYHVLANTICMSGALLGYNALSVIRRHLGEGGLARVFLTPLPEQPGRTDTAGQQETPETPECKE